jgi:hypothetical protein
MKYYMSNQDIKTPSLYEVSQMGDDAGLVGEDDTHLTVFISCIYGGFVWMRGPARAGKDEAVDAVEYCLPEKGGFGVFRVPSSSSPTALFKKAGEMNTKKIHRYPDLASLPEHLETILKAHGEGNSATHSLATGTDQGETKDQTIQPPDAFILFHASDNEKIDPDDYPELRNRALMVSVDAREEHTKKINERQAREEAGLYEPNLTEDRSEEIRNYISSIPKKMYLTDRMDGDIMNPVAVAINNQNPLPQKFVEARQDFPRLLRFMKSVTLFHYKDRMTWLDDGAPKLLVTPKDAWLAMRIFGEDMILSALNLRDRDLIILHMLRKNMQNGASKAELQMELRDAGMNVTERDVNTSLKGMLNKGYVKKDQSSSPILWSATPFADVIEVDVQLDWAEVVEDTKETVYEAMPEENAEKYVEQFCVGEGLLARHPLTGKTMDLTEFEGLESAVEEKVEVEGNLFDSTGYGADSQNDDEEEVRGDGADEQDTQGTLGGEIGA